MKSYLSFSSDHSSGKHADIWEEIPEERPPCHLQPPAHKTGKITFCDVPPCQSSFPDGQDKKADLCIHTYVDDVMRMLMARLQLDIPEYDPVFDPVKQVTYPTTFS